VNRLVCAALGLVGLLLALAPAWLQAAAPRVAPQESEKAKSVRDGVFSAAQAERGDQIFKARCASCHQPAEFTTPAFMAAWTGQTAEDLFEAIRTKMPTDNPGSLRRQEYADLLAYLFSLNGLPAGEVELNATVSALKQVLIEAPIKGDAGPH
jgi:mono/diheme cytochrome c family protein